MKVLMTDADVGALEDPELRSLMLRRIEELSEYGGHFSELVRFVVMEHADEPEALGGELNLDVRLRSPDVAEWIGENLELVYVLSDDGRGATVLLPRSLAESPTWRSVASIRCAAEVPAGEAT